jgi:hypothetical protein
MKNGLVLHFLDVHFHKILFRGDIYAHGVVGMAFVVITPPDLAPIVLFHEPKDAQQVVAVDLTVFCRAERKYRTHGIVTFSS